MQKTLTTLRDALLKFACLLDDLPKPLSPQDLGKIHSCLHSVLLTMETALDRLAAKHPRP